MSDKNGVRKYEYRPCRVEAGFNVDFRSGEKTLGGLCSNVSNTGIRAVLDGPVFIGSAGLLALRHPMGALQLEAQVAYIENGQAGLVFLFQSDWEREVTASFIASIANQNADLLVVRLP
jgi:hypothetical protein